MKDIEINSDKGTVIVIICCMAFCLLVFVSDLFALARYRPEFFDLHFWDYLVAIFNVYAAVTIYRDVKLRELSLWSRRHLLDGARAFSESRDSFGQGIS